MWAFFDYKREKWDAEECKRYILKKGWGKLSADDIVYAMGDQESAPYPWYFNWFISPVLIYPLCWLYFTLKEVLLALHRKVFWRGYEKEAQAQADFNKDYDAWWAHKQAAEAGPPTTAQAQVVRPVALPAGRAADHEDEDIVDAEWR